MKRLPDRTKVDDALERICTDNLFKRSHMNELLLRFLVDQAYKGNDVKEQVIGLELFKNDYSPEQNDSKIRVAVYYLRKKLDAYYADAGGNEEIRFCIKKGQYNLSFERKSEEVDIVNSIPKSQSLTNSKVMIRTIGVLVILVAIIILFSIKGEEQYLWKPFIDSEQTTCIIADHYAFSNELSPKNRVYAVHADVKNRETLQKFQEQFPDHTFKSGGFTLTTKMASFGVHYLDRWFLSHQGNFDLQLESETQYDDYTRGNMIYIGQAKTMVASKPFFLKKSKKFGINSDGFMYTGKKKKMLFLAKSQTPEQEEYAMVSFQKLENGNSTLFFVSQHDIGVMATLKKFTSKEELAEFAQLLPSRDSEFNALFKVSGLLRTDMSCELVELEIVE